MEAQSQGSGSGGRKWGGRVQGEKRGFHHHGGRNDRNRKGRGGSSSSHWRNQQHDQNNSSNTTSSVNTADPAVTSDDWRMDDESTSPRFSHENTTSTTTTSNDDFDDWGIPITRYRTPSPTPEVKFELPETNAHLKEKNFRRETHEEKHLVQSINGHYEIDCRGLHNVEEMCMFCDGRRGDWASANAKTKEKEQPDADAAFAVYQQSVIESIPERFRNRSLWSWKHTIPKYADDTEETKCEEENQNAPKPNDAVLELADTISVRKLLE